MKKLQSKIILSMVICSLIVSLITSVVGVINSTNMVESQVKENLITVTSNISAKLQAELGKMESGTVAMASVGEKLEKDKISDSDYYREFSNRVEYFISATSKNLKNISSIYFQVNPQLTPGSVRNIEYKYNLKNQKFMRQYSKTQSADSFNRENEKLLWYFDAVDSKSGTWGDLAYDYGLEKNIITYSTPIYNNEDLVGVLGIDIPFEVFEKFIADSNTSNSKGFSFLLDYEKNILIHDTLDVGSSIDDFEDNRYAELSKNIDNNNLEVFTVDTPENIYYSTFEKLPNGWTLVTFSYYDDIMSFSFDLITQFTVVGLVSLAITIFIAFILGKFITNPIKKLTNLINITTDLDLKNDSSYDYMLKYKDEVGTMVKAIAEMRSTLRSMVSDLSQNSSDVLSYSKELMQSIDTNSRSMDEVRNAMKEIASGSSDQANKAQSGKETVDTFSEKMISTASRAELLGKSSNDTLQANEEGKQAMVSLREKFKENTIIVNEVGHSVENLEHASDRIETIIKTIVDIAEQTNLLALNAAIEAARAGEHGRGFAVVSDEIRALAEQTSQSTKEIHSIVNGIKENITQTKSKTYEAEEINSTTNSVLESTSDIFDKINDNMNETIQEISGIIDSIYHVNSEKDAISTSMEDILFVSEETAASSEEVFASVEEQARSIEHIADASNELENLSKKLKSIVDKFDI